jgi:hypothetical protein
MPYCGNLFYSTVYWNFTFLEHHALQGASFNSNMVSESLNSAMTENWNTYSELQNLVFFMEQHKVFCKKHAWASTNIVSKGK